MSGWKEKLEGMITAYGPVAFGVWVGLFVLTWTGFALAIAAGFDVEGAGGSASTLVAAYLATQLTKPVRVLVTVALTPFLARLLGRGARPPAPTEPADGDRPGPTPGVGSSPPVGSEEGG